MRVLEPVARETHPPDLHDAILASGYKPAPFAE